MIVKLKIIITSLSVISLLFASKAKAQYNLPHPFSLGIGVESGFSGTHGTAMFVFNGILRLQYEVAPKFAITFASGVQTYSYIHLDDAEAPGNPAPYGRDYNFVMIPVKAGIKYYYVARAYCDIEAGAGFANRLESGAKLLVSPGAGYAFKKWDLSVRYENLSTSHENIGMLGINCTYKFRL